MSCDPVVPEPWFLADRMLDTLTRYLRFMGYDTFSANSLGAGDPREDTVLLARAQAEHRILLTRDRELANRGGELAVYILSEEVLYQVQQLAAQDLVKRRISMTRCSLCNTVLREATEAEIVSASYAPIKRAGYTFFWCSRCGKLYWNGFHQRKIQEKICSLPGSGY